MNQTPTITLTFNIVLLLYLVFFACVNYAFEPISKSDVPWDLVYEWNPILAVGFVFLLIGISIFWGSKLIQYFWNRFLTDLFQIRAITFNESIAVFLILGIIGIL